MDDVVWTKVIALFGLLLLVLVFGLLPIKLARAFSTTRDGQGRTGAQRLLPLLSCFAGGVFLTTCLMDLLPEVQEQFGIVFEKTGVDINYPIAEFVITMGFLFILAVEQTVLGCKERSPTVSRKPYRPRRNVKRNTGDGRGDMDFEVLMLDGNDSTDDELDNTETENNFATRLRSYALLVALSLHSLFEGLAIGLRNETEGVLRLFAAVAIHKCILAFSLGLKLVQSKLKTQSIVLSCLFFALTSPLGVCLGILCQTIASDLAGAIITAVLQALANGTLFYITFLEVLAHELNSQGDRFWKVVTVTIGVTSMAALVMLSD